MNKFNQALKQELMETPPIWFMRQAGRYHSHYQKLRVQNSFLELCRKPELACEVALGPIQDFDFDAAILFSDILFPLDALGFGLDFGDRGPFFQRNLDPDFLTKMTSFDEAWPQLEFQKKAMQMTRNALPSNKGLIGFVGGLWTLFTFAMDSDHKPPLINSKRHLSLFTKFCDYLVPLIIKNIELQFEGGADMVCIFDTSAGELSPRDFEDFVVPQLSRVIAKFQGRIMYYSKGTTPDHFSSPQFMCLNFIGQGYDHRWDLKKLLKFEGRGIIQGNFDQSLLFAEGSEFDFHLNRYIQVLKTLTVEQRRGWISGLGHGVLPKTPVDNVKRFIERIRKEFS